MPCNILGQLCDVVLTISLCLTLWQPHTCSQQLTDVLQAAHVRKLLLEKLLHSTTCNHRNNFDAIVVEIQILRVRVVVDEKAVLDDMQIHLVYVDGGEQVLEHSGLKLHVHAMRAEAVEHQEAPEWWVNCLLVYTVVAQGGDHIMNQCVLVDLEGQSGA